MCHLCVALPGVYGCLYEKINTNILRLARKNSPLHKAVVAGPAGRRAPDHFLDEYAFRRVPFSYFGSFFLVLTSDFQFIERLLRVSSIDRPSQGVKTLKNNAIIIMTIIILMGRVERKPDVVAFQN